MKLSDLTPSQSMTLNQQCGKDYKEWLTRTNDGRIWGTDQPLSNESVFYAAFSRGVQAVLKITEIVKS